MIEPILNRWRGTGDIFNVYKFSVTGTMIYAIYLALLFGLVTGSVIIGVVTLIGFLAGESFGWGKWVGTLVTDEPKDLEVEYLDKEGYGFPYIHYIANFIAPERENFRKHFQSRNLCSSHFLHFFDSNRLKTLPKHKTDFISL